MNDPADTSAENVFLCLAKICDNFNKSQTLDISITKNLFYKITNVFKTYQRKIKKYMNYKYFFEAPEEQEFMDRIISLPLESKNPGRPIGSSKSIIEMKKSAKYARLNEISSTYSPATQKEFALNILKRSPADLSCSIDLSNQFFELSEIECLSLMIYFDISVNKYKKLRKFFIDKNMPFLKRYQDVLDFKKKYCSVSTIITENTLKASFSSVLENSIRNLLNFSSIPSNEMIDVSVKYGGDGLTDGSDYKIIKESQETCDNTTFVVCVSIIEIRTSTDVLFRNDSPSSPFYCRPVQIYFKKETSNFLKHTFASIQEELSNIPGSTIEYDDKIYYFKYTYFPCMNDGKVVNAILDIKYTKECFICGLRGSEMMQRHPSDSIFKFIEIFKYGIQPLHILIRMTEWVLKIAYHKNIPVDCDKSYKKSLVHGRKIEIHDEIYRTFGLNIDMPSIKNGRTTEGNMARKLFTNHLKFAEILDLDKEFIKNIAILLACISCYRAICPAKFLAKSCEVFNYYIENYSAHVNITPTVHKLLSHGHQMFIFSPYPPGILSEQMIELSHKFTKKFKKLSFSNSRKNILRDIFNRFFNLSNPQLSENFLKLNCINIEMINEDLIVNMIRE